MPILPTAQLHTNKNRHPRRAAIAPEEVGDEGQRGARARLSHEPHRAAEQARVVNGAQRVGIEGNVENIRNSRTGISSVTRTRPSQGRPASRSYRPPSAPGLGAAPEMNCCTHTSAPSVM